MPGFGEVGVDIAHVFGNTNSSPGLLVDIGGNRNFFLVVVQAITAANHELVVEWSRTPGEPDLWTEVVLLRSPAAFCLVTVSPVR